MQPLVEFVSFLFLLLLLLREEGGRAPTPCTHLCIVPVVPHIASLTDAHTHSLHGDQRQFNQHDPTIVFFNIYFCGAGSLLLTDFL